jgi:hypothetical protein
MALLSRFRRYARPAFLLGIAVMLIGPRRASAQNSSPAPSAGQGQASSTAQVPARQSEPPAQPSLGDLARTERANQAARKQTKVFTNDNLPAAAGNLTVLGPPEGQGAAEAAAGKHGERHAKHDEQDYRARALQFHERLDIDRRELEVLQQSLGQNQVQYYPDPSQAMEQQHSREDIDRVRQEVDQKQQQVEADQQAISDLEDQLRRDGGDPTWLEPGPSGGASRAIEPDLSGVARGSEEYWRRRFQAARETLARAREQRQLAEDELRLLQSQQAHDWGTPAGATLTPKIADKQSELESKQADEAQAQQELDSLESAFRQSGALEEWSKPADAAPDSFRPQQGPDR